MSVSKKLGPRAHVDVNDRRLKPIYESLDNGDNKKALQEAERVLKKTKLVCAKALKCLAMIRLGRKAEARAVLTEIRKIHNIDEGTLQALTACYKELLDFQQIVSMYEDSFACNPNDEATLTQLFNAYVRVGDCQNQQQTAMKLYKLFPNKTPYLFWVIMSYVMMSIRDYKSGKKLYLPLAEGMTLKYLKEAKHESESEVMVYMTILERQKKFKELLDVLKGPMGDEMVQNFKYKTLLQIQTLINLENWKELNVTYKRLLLENLDDIVWFREYLKYALVLIGSPLSELSLSGVSFDSSVTVGDGIREINAININEDDSIESMVRFLSSCIELSNNSNQGYSPRAPYLAQLELIMSIRDGLAPSWKNNLAPQYMKLLADYFKKFGDKPCCFNDLKKFFDVLNHEEKVTLKEMFSEILIGDKENITLPEDYKAMQKHLFVIQANHYMGIYEALPCHEQLQLVESFIEFYHHGLKFGENLTSTDIQPSDSYALLSAEILYIAAMKKDDVLHLIRAISLLDSALEKSPSNHFMKLLLVKYHSTLGTLNQGHQTYETLDIKHIQNDTLGYIIHNPLMRFGQYQIAQKLFDSALKFFESVQRESTDFIINCYKYGTFDKIKEFVGLRKKLTRSIQFACISVDRVVLKVISSCHDHKAMEELVSSCSLEAFIFHGMDCKLLLDNRDFKVISDWKLFGSREKGFQAKSFLEEKMWLALQTLTLRTLWKVVEETKAMLASHGSGANNSVENNVEHFDGVCNDIANSHQTGTALPCSKKKNDFFFSSDDDDIKREINNVEEEKLTSQFAFCSLFENDIKDDGRRLSLYERICGEAKELVVVCCSPDGSYAERFFKTPLKVFIDKRLEASFIQFVEFFNSVVGVTGNACSDKSYVPISNINEVIAHELFIKNHEAEEKGNFSLKNVACLEEATLLVQHLSCLLVIFNCCHLLIQPFKSKKGKKKSKKQLEIPNILQSYNFLAHGLAGLHSVLINFFKKTSDTFSPDLSAVFDKLDESKSVDSVKVVKAAKIGFDRMRDDMSELLQQIGTQVDKFKEKDQSDLVL